MKAWKKCKPYKLYIYCQLTLLNVGKNEKRKKLHCKFIKISEKLFTQVKDALSLFYWRISIDMTTIFNFHGKSKETSQVLELRRI